MLVKVNSMSVIVTNGHEEIDVLEDYEIEGITGYTLYNDYENNTFELVIKGRKNK